MQQEDRFFLDTMEQIMKKGIENIPYQETLKELEKHSLSNLLDEEDQAEPKEYRNSQNEKNHRKDNK